MDDMFELNEDDGIDLENTSEELKRMYRKMKEIFILSQECIQMDLKATHTVPVTVQ